MPLHGDSTSCTRLLHRYHTTATTTRTQLFSSYEAQVAALEALRQKEAAECKALQAALDSSKLDCHQKLQAEAAKW